MSHNTMLAMIHKPGMSAGKRWHKTYRFSRLRHLARVVKGVKFRDEVEANSETGNSRSAA